ncbi:isoprenoid synthase domain-containing protein [Aspergillus crustosus]
MTAYTYPFASASVQEAIASFAAYAISIDDLTSDFASDLQAYTTNLTLGCPQRHSLLQGFTTHLSEQPRVFGAYGGDMIIKGALEFISSALVEFRDMDTLKLPAEAGDFLIPFRAKTGVAEPFAFFCFPEDTHPEQDSLGKYLAIVPTIMLFLDYVNDILSFYKENMRMKLASGSDSASFIKSYARLHGISLREALQRTTVEAVDVVKRLRAVCKQDPAVFGHIEPFIQGYISFHLSFPRYKLSELDIPLAHRGGITL